MTDFRSKINFFDIFISPGDEAKLDNKLGLVEKLLSILRSVKMNMKVRERAASALGNLCLGEARFPHRRLMMEKFLEAAQVKNIYCTISQYSFQRTYIAELLY